MTGDEKPHRHSNCIHIETGRGHMRTTIAAVLAMASVRPEVLIVDDRYNDPPPLPAPCCDGHSLCCDGHSLCDRHQAIKDLSDRLPRPRSAKHRGLSLLELMVGLGAARAPRPPWSTPTIQEGHACSNCDAEHDGVDWHPNHTDDIYCRYYEDDL